MKYLFSEWKILEKRLKGKGIFLFLDYDGTLAPIAQTPQKAKMAQGVMRALEALVRRPSCKVAIISGRSLRDIRNRVGLQNVIYAGNHGFELRGPKIRYKNSEPLRYRKILNRIKYNLEEKLTAVRGAFIEDKGFSLALHYRLVAARDITTVKTIFHETIIIPRVKGLVKITTGKKVLEVRPPGGWNKGTIVLWLLARQLFAVTGDPFIPIYIGDDVTDEDAFRALKSKGITIAVGKHRASSAKYFVRNPREVEKFLSMIAIFEAKGCHA